MRALILMLILLLPGFATAQTGRFGSAGTPNIGPPDDALIPSLAAKQDRLEELGWMIRGQATFILQGNAGFRSPYRAEGSFTPAAQARNTLSTDLILGRRLWQGAEVIFNPTLTRGFGLSNSTGIAAFPNGEAFRLGSTDPTVSVPRLFIRQTIALSEDTVPPDNDPLRFTTPLPRERITITLGKFAVWDIFDDNRYAHDPRTQFMSWALVGGGAFDYAADARGYTEGLAVEWENGTWAVRGGAFRVARQVNGLFLDPSITRGFQLLASVERFWRIGEREGALRLIYGYSRARQSRWNELFSNGFQTFDINPYGYRAKNNANLSFDQEITQDFGVFARASWNDGQTQNWMFTEMDRALSAGAALTGQRWGRPSDTIGLGTNIGWISGGRRRYLEDGGIGFITGDGRLNYRPEWLTETYYDARIAPGVNAALGYTLVVNPAYNADRGPVSIFSLRMRVAF
ncbi:carbohydrate porin [Sediminicoccus sp. KRV36]|uniref:carbohydrate porin n=1 Tax=Sediminicoccus sp. KRV36 TaxID=3133721 RepID=UPI00200EEA69|nr:carbohydrate porin [Sediminicoccus rosea]UPY34992.1 carbohydrate porin [Sediminicoccus rosea]